MAVAERRVRHLHLTAADELAARRGAARIEDALRCASLPGDGGRVLLLRRLSLGRVDPGLSSQALALHIERRLAQLNPAWVHGDAPEAARADAVWFEDTETALARLALRIAEHGLPDDWFWPQILPALRTEPDPTRILGHVVARLDALPHAAASLARLVSALVEAGHAARLSTLFDTPTRTRLARAATRLASVRRPVAPVNPVANEANPAPGTAPDGTTHAPDTGLWRTPGGRALRLADAAPDVQSWLVPLLASAGWRPLPASKQTTPGTPQRPATAPHDGTRDTAQAPGSAAPTSRPDATTSSASIADEAGHRAPHSPPAQSHSADDAPAPRAHRPEADPASLTATAAGGLLFLLPVLARLGFDDWSASLPVEQSAHLVARCLLGALGRLGLADDPFADALSGLLIEPFELDFTPPEIWSDPRIGVTANGPLDDATVAALWLTAARRYLRRVARIGLASTVRRPAGFSWSPTHVDVHFDLKDCDLRVRRAGLDLDPGWLPWMGRVVTFHFEKA